MNFGASRLGFWYNKPPDRGYKKKALVFYDPLTNGPGGNTNYYAVDVNPQTQVYPNLAARLTAQGLVPTLVQSYAALNSLNLSEYSQIWDIGYASPYETNPNNPTSKLNSYLQSGGAMFILGENSGFGVRDDAIDIFLTNLGGGNITRSSTDYNYVVYTTLLSEFRLANSSSSLAFSRPGAFIAIGNGTAMTVPFGAEQAYVSVMWKTGSLTGAPTGSVISVLDINFLVGSNLNNNFIDNLIQSLNKR